MHGSSSWPVLPLRAAVVVGLAALHFAALSVLAAGNASADNWCDVPDGSKPRVVDRLVIGEYGLFPMGSNCPPLDGSLGPKFRYPVQRVQVVMRLEAAEEYLQSRKTTEPITAMLRKDRDDHTMSYLLDIGNPVVDIAAATGEAALKGGYFDWQFDVNFNTLVRPGTYTLTLRQANEQICLSDGACQIQFEVLDP